MRAIYGKGESRGKSFITASIDDEWGNSLATDPEIVVCIFGIVGASTRSGDWMISTFCEEYRAGDLQSCACFAR